jgi:2-polyprenyl-3-methyl-5-hydroxy-6-metoxy-1,4-benzoquinol methylase
MGVIDTDRDWCAIADAFPYFGVITEERYKNPSAEDLKEFFATGQNEIAAFLARSERIFGPFEPKSALDFGCGVGRLLIPLAKLAGNATGVDVSDKMLSLARKHAKDAGVSVTLTKSIPADQTFDWVNSHVVLQHISPRRGYSIIHDLWDALAPGGLLVLHITTFRDKAHLGDLLGNDSIVGYDGERAINYSKVDDQIRGILMYDYDLSHVFANMPMANGCPLYLEKVDHAGHHGFRIYVRKRPPVAQNRAVAFDPTVIEDAPKNTSDSAIRTIAAKVGTRVGLLRRGADLIRQALSLSFLFRK